MNQELFLSLLALDSYNREYDANLPVNGDRIGNARVLDREAFSVDETQYAVWQAAGFYAIAYEWNGETVISYRGTDNPSLWPNSDIWNGWTLGGGFADASQGGLALDSTPPSPGRRPRQAITTT
ncbi:hypothetical protein J4558_01960 [Leptolyngbya sp. 15MV]|nr:hypothetical protein J4558_01960 [Leptolyngbya sp. 15MV]